jgi:hypothetical protein
MAVNLIRNARVFFTTGLDSVTGKILPATARTAANTYELQPLDGMSFSQNTTLETVTLAESGSTPSRGQRSFATSLDPVDWSFSTYIRPRMSDGSAAVAGLDSGDYVRCEESVLWNAMFSAVAVDVSTTTALPATTNAAYSETASTGTTNVPVSTVTTVNSNLNQLLRFGLIVMFDDTTILIHNCVVDQASIDFGLDQIGTIAWTGKGTELEVMGTAGTVPSAGTFGGGLSGVFTPKSTSAKYITNRLSAVQLASTAGKYGQSAVNYVFPITGGNITIANNVTYLVPAAMGTVNKPIDYYTGTRSITGNLTAYLRTGSTDSVGLMSTLLTQASSFDQNQFAVTLGLGGSITAPTSTAMENKLIISLPSAMLQIPQVNTEQVVSTTINFTAQGANGSNNYDIDQKNEMTISYYAGPAV